MMLKKTEVTSVKPRFAAGMSAPTKLAIALVSAVAVQAFADDYPKHSFGLYWRSDLQINSSDDKADKNDEEDSMKFANNTTRLNFTGPLDDMTSYRVRFRLGRTGDASNDIENHSSQVDYAYIDRKIMGDHKIRMGKFFFHGSGGREGDYAGQDVYLYSLAGQATTAYRLGVGFMPSIAGQNFVLSVVNGADLGEKNHSQLGYGAAWWGNIADGMVQPIVSYAMLNSTEQKCNQKAIDDANSLKTVYEVGNAAVTKKIAEASKASCYSKTVGYKYKKSATDTYYAIGARVNLDMAMFEADYIGVEKGARVDTDKDYKANSIVLLAQAKLMDNMFRPHIKYEMSELKDPKTKALTTDDMDKDRTAYTVALEYYPNGGKKGRVDWRVHAAYTEYKDDYNKRNTSLKDETVSQFLLGFSANFTNG